MDNVKARRYLTPANHWLGDAIENHLPYVDMDGALDFYEKHAARARAAGLAG